MDNIAEIKKGGKPRSQCGRHIFHMDIEVTLPEYGTEDNLESSC
jgi:hypothetical protein